PTPTATPSPTPTPLPTPTPPAAVPVPLGSAAAFLRANPGLVAAALAALLALVKMIQNGRRR
ncbi:MAG: chromosome condensation regulator, partial [Anaerolineae bacterium]